MERAAEMLRQNPGGNNFPFLLNDLGGIYLDAGYPEHARALFLEAYAYVDTHFSRSTDGYPYRESMLNGRASAHLAALYDADGRPDLAAPFRDAAAAFTARLDSSSQALSRLSR